MSDDAETTQLPDHPPANALEDTVLHQGNSRVSADPQARVGTKLGNHRILGVLGQGGMGIVFEAMDERLDRKVAIKTISKGLLIGASGERFLQEARAVARLNHPNVVSIYEIGEHDSESYFVLEYVDGGSLAELLDRAKNLHWREATQIIADACRGLVAAHSAGLIHRDIKPANLLRSRNGGVKLADFGLVKLSVNQALTITSDGPVVGTPAYMSPEQCHGDSLDARTDLYSLGATYFALLTRRAPYADSTSVPKLMFAHCYKPVPDPRDIDATIPEACSQIIRRSMAKEPADRYPDAGAMLADLLLLLDGGSFSWSGVNDTRATPNRRQLLVGGVAGLTALAALVPAVIALSRPRKETSPNPSVLDPIGFANRPPIRVGLLHSLSGTMAASESTVVDGTLLAIDELNQSGGVLGRRIEPVVADGMSDPDVFAREAERLIAEEKVCTVFGCWTSASRKTVRPIFEKHDHLLVYPLQYEGLEDSPNIIYNGATPNQQILPAVKWAYTDLGRKFFLVGSDYIFPRVAGAIMRDQIDALGGEIVGEEYLPLGSTDVQRIVRAIVEARPSVILNTINGDSNLAFFRALRAAGIVPAKTPTLSFSIGENEVRAIGARTMAGDYAAWNYFASIDRPENRAFRDRFQAKFGPQRLTSDPTEAAYFGVHLWAKAVEAAGSIETKAIHKSFRNQSLAAPEGPVKIDPENQHTWKIARIGKIGLTGEFEVFQSSDRPIRPEPFPASRPRAAWEKLLADLHRSWGGRWAADAR